MQAGRGAARLAVLLVNPNAAKALDDVIDSPARYLARGASASGRGNAELTALALMRMAGNDPDAAAGLLDERWERALPADLSAWVWARDRQAGGAEAAAECRRLFSADRYGRREEEPDIDWPDEMLGWKARAALRADNGRPRWQQVVQAINAMSTGEATRTGLALLEGARSAGAGEDSQNAESLHALSRELLEGLRRPDELLRRLGGRGRWPAAEACRCRRRR